MGSNSCEPPVSSSLWLELVSGPERRVFELRAGDDRGVAVGSIPAVDMPVRGPGVAAVHCHFEREGDDVCIVPDAAAELWLDGTSVSSARRLPERAHIAVGKVGLAVSVCRYAPPDTNLARAKQLKGAAYLVALPTEMMETTAYPPVASAHVGLAPHALGVAVDVSDASLRVPHQVKPFSSRPTLLEGLGNLTKRSPIVVATGTVLPGLVLAFLLVSLERYSATAEPHGIASASEAKPLEGGSALPSPGAESAACTSCVALVPLKNIPALQASTSHEAPDHVEHHWSRGAAIGSTRAGQPASTDKRSPIGPRSAAGQAKRLAKGAAARVATPGEAEMSCPRVQR